MSYKFVNLTCEGLCTIAGRNTVSAHAALMSRQKRWISASSGMLDAPLATRKTNGNVRGRCLGRGQLHCTWLGRGTSCISLSTLSTGQRFLLSLFLHFSLASRALRSAGRSPRTHALLAMKPSPFAFPGALGEASVSYYDLSHTLWSCSARSTLPTHFASSLRSLPISHFLCRSPFSFSRRPG